MDRESSLKNWNVYSPQRQNNLFLAPPHSGLGKAVAGIYPGRAMQWDALASSPTLQTLLPLPRPLASVRFEPPACQAGLTSAGLEAAGSDGCLLGRIHFPCGYVVYVLLCCWGVFPVLTLYSPRSIVWGLFFFSSLSSCYAVFFFNSTCISLLIILVWLCMWRIIKNLEPWTSRFAVFCSITFFATKCIIILNPHWHIAECIDAHKSLQSYKWYRIKIVIVLQEERLL